MSLILTAGLLAGFVGWQVLDRIGVTKTTQRYNVPIAWQGTLYTCVPTCVWMLLKAFGAHVKFNNVVTGTRCTKEGTTYQEARKYLRRFDVRSRYLRPTVSGCKGELDAGKLLMATVTNYRHPHAVLIIGYRIRKRQCQLLVYDPLRPPRWCVAREFMGAVSEIVSCNSAA